MSIRRPRPVLAVALLAAACSAGGSPVSETPPSHDAVLDAGGIVGDFTETCAYLDDHGNVVARRFEHVDHGMPVTLLRIQSVPQVFLHFNTPPISDRGEPHTGEHLLLGKGRKGKQLSNEQGMSLVQSTAYTSQTDVVYAWNCGAGKQTFYRTVEQYLDAMLLPNYTDEEVRREVMNLGVNQDAKTGKLTLEEKGTIYNEMVSSFEKRWVGWGRFSRRLYGKDHPHSYSSGGDPAAVREMEPHHIHQFHRDHYHLSANVGMIVALPDSIPQGEFLEKLSGYMAALDATPELAARPKTLHEIPPARPEADRSFELLTYPNANEQDIGIALIAWPPVADWTQRERVTADLLLATIGDGESSTLYKRLMDSSTREVEVDASAMGAWLEVTKVDAAPFVYFDGLPPKSANAKTMNQVVGIVQDEVARIAGLRPGSKALTEFNEKALVKLTQREKDLRKQLNSPPLFGHRLSRGFWLEHLQLVDLQAGTRRSLTLSPRFSALRAQLEAGENPWAEVVELLGVSGKPYVTCCVPSKAELERHKSEKAERIEGYVKELKVRYGMAEEQDAIAAYKQDIDAATEVLAKLEQGLPKPKLVADVPLTMDPSLKLETTQVGGIATHRGIFDNMSFAEIALALRLEGVEPSRYHWLPILPAFLTNAGVHSDRGPVPYDQVQRERQQEIYGLGATLESRPGRGRHELLVTASGANLDESRRAVEWMEIALFHPWVDTDNAPRLRDLVSQAIRNRRTQLGGREENWVRNPAGALQWQTDPLYVSMSSHHAALFHLARVEWLLMDPPTGDDAEVVDGLLSGLTILGQNAPSDAKGVRAALEGYVEGVKSGKNAKYAKWVVPIATRITEMVGDMAPGHFGTDIQMLANVAAEDLMVPPADALAEFDALRSGLLRRGNARLVLTGSRTNLDALTPSLEAVSASMAQGKSKSRIVKSEGVVRRRMRDHVKAGDDPLHIALVHQAGTSGVFINSTDAAGLTDLNEDTLVKELAGRVFGGAGAHGFFMQTWGAGLAYSNGLSVSASRGRASYYAERCPDLVQTMKFVTGLARDAGKLDDPYLGEYAVAVAVRATRESDRYEARTRAAAADIVDGDTPERVSAYRKALLALREREDLWSRMKPHVTAMTGRPLPGLDPKSRAGKHPTFFVIAPDKLLTVWEEYLRDTEGESLARITGRDFWVLPHGDSTR